MKKKPCTDCPFRRKSIPGWLGHFDLNDMRHYYTSEARFPCHKELETKTAQEADLCAGMIQMMVNSFKRPSSNPEVIEAVNTAKSQASEFPEVHDFGSFMKHHTLNK